jgi:hypothetical protein
MRLTETQLKQIIKEELEKTLAKEGIMDFFRGGKKDGNLSDQQMREFGRKLRSGASRTGEKQYQRLFDNGTVVRDELNGKGLKYSSDELGFVYSLEVRQNGDVDERLSFRPKGKAELHFGTASKRIQQGYTRIIPKNEINLEEKPELFTLPSTRFIFDQILKPFSKGEFGVQKPA